MRVLLGSGGLRTPARRKVYFEEMARIFAGCERVVFIPYAGADHAHCTARIIEFSAPAGVAMVGIETFDDPVRAIQECDGLYVGGGNTFLLTKTLHENHLIEIVRERVAGGMPYMGVSAGSNVACPTMQTTNDMPVVQPPSFETFGLVPFQVNAHYHDGNIWLKEGETYRPHFGETRAQRIGEFHEHNDRAVIGLWEGSFLRWDGEIAVLIGGDGTVFRSAAEPSTHRAGSRFDRSLHQC